MKTVDKAMKVLSQFSLAHKEIGLSEMARMAELDKAATRRLLVALSEYGFVEQVAETRKYRLGYGFLALARIREATVPLTKAAQDVANWLAAETNETVHLSVPGAHAMSTLAFCLPERGNVINLRAADTYPFHAASSGLVYLAFCSPATQARLLALKREKLTTETVTDVAALKALLKQFKSDGYSQSRNVFEFGVASVAMPFFSDGPDPTGTISIAVPDANMNAERRADLVVKLGEARARLEKALTGLSLVSA